ncbi:GntR family transcriptional regulator [Faecalicatena acetigenes]|uniref:GntR family transcriptional regulator n=1 Tax=Faecalicatena acetigenes TaxID=2981790 RepID=A0ABT2TA61_9FIRM|nr:MULTISPECIES: GntR family transcriptional regulator [Lachnospiraceae]MCU6747173.1 GntR family transcriptional regulator [Faecalicatena acetigenes]SCH69557.1 L-lactate utilization operon repressor [uncultured Clostridium sp.]
MPKNNSLQVKRVTLVDAVVEQMVEAIKSGRFKEGNKIPSEKMLTQEFGVSRTTLREAFKKLEYFGILSIRQGNGTYVVDADSAMSLLTSEEKSTETQSLTSAEEDSLLPLLADDNSSVKEAIRSMFTIGNYQLSHYIEARHCIEKEAFKLATERLDERALISIEQTLKKQEYCESPEEYAKLDYDFHSQLIMLSKNEFLFQFWSALSPFVKEQLQRSSAVEGVIKHSYSYHRKILNALKDRNYKKAYSLNTDHLRILQGRMLTEASKQTRISQENFDHL